MLIYSTYNLQTYQNIRKLCGGVCFVGNRRCNSLPRPFVPGNDAELLFAGDSSFLCVLKAQVHFPRIFLGNQYNKKTSFY